MSNAMTMLRFELRKVFSQKAYWIALAIMCFIFLANELAPIFFGNYETQQERQRALSGTAIDEAFLDEIKTADNLAKYDPLDFCIKSATGSTDMANLTEETFYQIRMEVCERLMTKSKLSDKEKEYWREQDKKNEKPFTYYYDGAYVDFFEIAGFMSLMNLILCAIGLTGIFADEKHKGADQLIFSSRYGKRNLFFVKVATSAIVGALSAIFLVLAAWVSVIAFMGPDGFQTALQIHMPTCMMHVSVGEACLYMTLLYIPAGVFVGIVSAFISLITMNHPVSMGAMIFLMFLSMFNLPESLGWIKTFWDMNPAVFIGSWRFEEYHVVLLGKFGFGIMQIAPFVWLGVALLLVLVSYVRYIKYEVKA